MSISRKDRKYIKKRGIEAINGRPLNAEYPYFTLSRIDSKEQFGPSLHYWINQNNGMTPGPEYHPSRYEDDRLISILEQMVIQGRDNFEINQQEEDSFIVYVIDPEWEEFVDVLMKKYPSK